MPTITEILGEDRAKRTWNGAYASAKTMVAECSQPTAIARAIADRETETAAILELLKDTRERVRRLEKETHGVRYCGVWSADRLFPEGGLTTHSGGLWVATCETRGVRPGDGSVWRLIVKRGAA